MSQIVLLRHGETAGQSSVRLFGSTDIPLSDIGRRQMERAKPVLAGIEFKTVITSPLARSRESAVIVHDGSWPEPTVVDDFTEIDFGEWEGLTYREIEERDPERYALLKTEGALARFPGGDGKAEFFSRVAGAARRVFERIEMPALAVLHKGVIRGVMAGLLGADTAELSGNSIELGSIHRLEKNGDGWIVTSANEISHLGELRIEHS